jgi:hypothetical protein
MPTLQELIEKKRGRKSIKTPDRYELDKLIRKDTKHFLDNSDVDDDDDLIITNNSGQQTRSNRSPPYQRSKKRMNRHLDRTRRRNPPPLPTNRGGTDECKRIQICTDCGKERR